MQNMADRSLLEAVACLVGHGRRLREQYHFEWGRQDEEAAAAIRFQLECRPLRDGDAQGNTRGDAARDADGAGGGWREVAVVAIVGGASSGKSTVFNNLLGGRLASRVTAKGHATRGPIAAVHEVRRDAVEAAIEAGLWMPSFSACPTGLDDNTIGEPDRLHVVYHTVDALRDLVLLDTPDFTSELARAEGDLALATLPWFDHLIVLVDHERWFDRQTIGRLRDESSRFGQDRFAVFNRGQSGELGRDQLTRLAQQSDRLGAGSHLVLEFRRGRGCCTFPPGTFEAMLAQLEAPASGRGRRLLQFVGRRATVILNNNSERCARLVKLHEDLYRAASGEAPTRRACFMALLTADERRHLDVISRTLRITETRQWLGRQADRIRQTLRKRLPVVGGLLAPASESTTPPKDADDRRTIGGEVFRSRCLRQLGAIDDAAVGSDFWAEVGRWASLEPPRSTPTSIDARRDDVQSVVSRLNESIEAWTAKVDSECRGASPRLIGAVGATSVAAAIALVMVAGPVGALTASAIHAALGGALGALATSAGAGVIAGPSLGRLLKVIREKLIGSAEFRAVEASAGEYRDLIVTFGRNAADESFAAAQALVLPEDDDLLRALTTLSDAAEGE